MSIYILLIIELKLVFQKIELKISGNIRDLQQMDITDRCRLRGYILNFLLLWKTEVAILYKC